MTQKETLEIMKMGFNVFLTGEPGTGKTYVLAKYMDFLHKKNIPVAVTASTGIAATHLDGVTIDSWSGLGIRDELSNHDLELLNRKFHLKNRLQKAKVLIIDEVSMISGVRLDLYDLILRNIRGNELPFGGLQVVLSGDLFQLPPVSSNRNKIDFIFMSSAWTELDLRICYLTRAFRQTDRELLEILMRIRQRKVDQNTVDKLKSLDTGSLNGRIMPARLYTHNIDVDAINMRELEKLPGDPHEFYMHVLGNEKLTSSLKNACLAPEVLKLKKNALVMFVRNNYAEGYVNGSMGFVKGFDREGNPEVSLFSGKKITVTPANWTIMDGVKIAAQLTQIPLRLAWAITVHKSQGMTLDAAEIDLSKSFLLGMGYVALSRVRSLSGLRLLGFNGLALEVNPQISEFDKYLLQLSDETSKNFAGLSFLKKWFKKRQFMYRLTS